MVGPCVECEVEAVVRHLDWHEVPRVRTAHCQADTLACGEGCGGEGGSAWADLKSWAGEWGVARLGSDRVEVARRWVGKLKLWAGGRVWRAPGRNW